MRILFITRKFPPSVGGMETLSKGLADHLPDIAKTDVLSWGGSSLFLLPFVLLSFFVRMHLYYKKADVVLLGDAVLSPLGWWAKHVLKKRVVVLVHGLDLTYKNPLYRIWSRLFSRGFDAYVCNSRATKTEAASQGYGPLHVIHPGIDSVDQFSQEQARTLLSPLIHDHLPPGAFVLGFLGRASRRKGLPWFLTNVFPSLPSHVHLLVAGSTPKEEIYRLLKDPSLLDRIHILGKVSDHERNLFFPALDVFLMPNIDVLGDQEGFGLVAIESSVRGTPVLASELEGVADAVLPDKTGWLLTPENDEAFVKTISYLASDTGLQTYLSIRERTHTETLDAFAWSKIIEMYARVFRTL